MIVSLDCFKLYLKIDEFGKSLRLLAGAFHASKGPQLVNFSAEGVLDLLFVGDEDIRLRTWLSEQSLKVSDFFTFDQVVMLALHRKSDFECKEILFWLPLYI